MSFTEILAGIGGLVVGYWLVAVFLPHAKKATGDAEPIDGAAPPNDGGAETPGHWSEVLSVPGEASGDEITAADNSRSRQHSP